MYGQPPHNGGSRRISPPHNGGTRWRSPPHNGGSQRRSPPHNGGSRRRSPPHKGGSRRSLPPQPREQHRPFENPDHVHSSQSQNYYFPSNPFFPQNPNFPNQNSNFGYSPFHQNPGFQFSSRGNYSDVVDRVDRAVIKARRDLIEAGENVSAWKVSQAALVMLNADSWDSLGLRMQQVPSLFQLIVTDGKINAFIHCFVAVQRITTLYDLEVAILKNEGVEQFEELNLGPLVKHPLVIHYFSITPDVAEVFRITSVEIISFLAEYMDADKRRRVNIDEFLNFIAEKKSTDTTEKLGVRIQSLGMHIAFIKQARQSKTTPVNKYLRTMKKESSKKIRNHALLSVQKQQFDEHSSTMCKNIKSFSSAEEELSGKHIRCIAGSEYENSDDDPDESAARSQSKFPVGNIKSSERPTTCPYPSASEEMMRLGLETEVEVIPHIARGSDKNSKDIGQSNRKRKHDGVQSSLSLPKKVPKRDMVQAKLFTSMKKKEKKNDKMWNQGCDVSNDFSHGDDSIKMFVNTWKEACQTNSVDEVFQRMLQFYKARKRVKVTRMFTSYPFCGLLHVAVTSIERGMWDSLYDKLHTIHQCGVTKGGSENRADSICVEVESAERGATNPSEKLLVCESGITIEDIHRKLSTYLVGDAADLSAASSYHEKFIFLLNKFCKLESWLEEQFSVKHFELLGYGNIWLFLEKNMHLFSDALQRFFTNDMHEKTPLEPSMLDCQFDLLLSQASQCLWENEEVDKRRISELLMRQFPLICLKVAGNDLMIDIEGSVKAKKGIMTLKSVVFSETLLKEIAVGKNNENMLEKADLENDVGHGDCIAMSKDAMKALVNAPMLIDLNLWLHWDMVFAPSLGSLVGWLLNDIKSEELLCLVTSCGKVLRVDHSATIDSFLNVLLQGNPFDTAAKLLSLLVLYGGEKSVPNSLLKCHARHAFEVLFKNHEDMKSHDIQGSLNHATFLWGQLIHDETTSSMSKKFLRSDRVARIVPLALRFILDCLGYLPVEFCHFAADILLTGLKPFVKDAPSAILDECERIDQRLMLHRAGMSLGIVEWIEDKHKLSAYSDTNLLMSSGSSCLKVTELDFSKGSTFTEEVSSKCPLSRNEISLSQDSMRINENRDVSCSAGVESYVPSDNLADSAKQHSCELESSAAKVIESIQREEFGLQPDLSLVESAMLNKQHARLGRALHCLSQELYSQDSHFILELVQNADDNIYLENVEPTLTFILQDKCIIVLNNERGFSADNVRALCDVGNSTKKGRNAGYIGKKGIGFKSVFRVTDAPEIHSNGFHIKFDISNGQIGFVLPTVVPPCDIDSYTRLASLDSDCNHCNTCIVLPFRSSLLETSAVENIVSMFSDLHPSLLLFLHRLHCIKFRNMLSDSTILMRKEVVGNGIVKVSLGEEKLTWFVASKELQADTIHPDISNTEISMAFTLQETLDGRYNAHLNQQPVFAFLPLRKYGLKFILQGDFVLPSSREEVDGDSPWNQWLLSEFPDLFVSAERSFCDLLCFKDNPAKGVTAYMSFVPLVGEVHGFFSSLPRMILSRLRMSNCLIIESTEIEWVPPCKVLRNWTQEARNLLPDSLLRKHLGVGFLHKDIVLPDLLARALGIEEYGLKVLFQVINSICSSVDGLKSMSLGWLCAWLNSIYTVSLQGKSSAGFETETDLMKDLKKIPFIPLSDGKYGSLDEGAIWLHADLMGATTNDEYAPETFPRLYFMIRTVSPTLLSAAAALGTSCSDSSIVDNVTRMLYRVGVQRLSAHQIVKMHILPFICRDQVGQGPRELLTEYYAFLMFHLQSSCLDCLSEKDQIIREVRDNAFILTNYGCKRPIEFPIHFSKQFENPIDMSRLIQGLDLEWHEIGDRFLKHPINKLLSGSVLKWRKFFQEIGITDFVRVYQVEKSISDVCSVPIATSDDDLNSKGSIARDWVSDEFVYLLSRLSSAGDKEKCKYLLEVLDSLWDDYFADKVTGFYFSSTGKRQLFDSSFTKTLRDVQWLASSMDNELHCPRELFHDCDDVRLIFGDNAPYAIPKVRSKKLLTALGLKTQVTVDDTLAILKVWRAKLPLSASLSQMSKFYTCIWSRMNTSERKVVEELCNEPFVFVPCKLVASHEDVVPGVLLSSKEVFWRDLTGSTDQVKMVCPEFDPHSVQHPFTKMLCSVYPSLRDFFVKECGVDEFPHFHGYLQILLQLSATALPSQAAKNVFQILLKWVDELNSGSLRSEDIGFLKQGLLTKDYLVLPTAEDKWVSLNPSFGLICWCDDDKLRKEFKDFDDIKFLYFGKLNDEEKEILKTKVSIFLRKLNIPSLSEVVTREAIYYGPTDSNFVASVVNWTLPYAQRYIYNSHPDKYLLLSQSGFENLKCLQIVVVEKLFYRNVIKSSHIVSKKRFECSSLLEGKILYVTRESDSHSIFMELSRLFSSGTPDLHLANFLHMITTMAESGSTEEQTEFFIMNSQKMPKLPAGESVWSLENVPLSKDSEIGLMSSSRTIDEKTPVNFQKRSGISSNWPPSDWKTAPCSAAKSPTPSGIKTFAQAPTEITIVENLDNDRASAAAVLGSLDGDHMHDVLVPGNVKMTFDPPHSMTIPHDLNYSSSDVAERDHLCVGTTDPHQALLTGRLGEFVAFKYFVGKHGEPFVKWVNETNETGLPYDLVVGDDEYIEVKATRATGKDWFHITSSEWQFAVEKGESFSIAQVVLSPDNTAMVTVYKNPVSLCQLGKLQLALTVHKS